MGTGKISLTEEEAAIMKEWQEITAARKKAERSSLECNKKMCAETDLAENAFLNI